MPISRRLFLRSTAQALSAASLLGAVPGLAAAADKDRKSVSASDLSVKDVSGLAVFAGEQVDYRYLPAAHTNGDLFVHFPKRNVIVAGGPVAADHWPVMDYLNGGFMHGFVRAYEILAEVAKPDTIIIPANGPTLTGADIVKQKDMYWALFKAFFIDFNKGFGPNDIVDAHPLKDFEAQYGDPAQFLDYAYRSLQLATIPH